MKYPQKMRRIAFNIHGQDGWPRFRWDQKGLANQLAAVRHRQALLIGRMQGLGFRLREEAVLRTLTQDVLRSSEIEGEILDIEQVRSSLARRLGLDIGALTPADRNVDGVVELMLDATHKYEEPLTEERRFGCGAALFPTGRSGMQKIRVGDWRDDASGPVQVVSGPIGRERVHYEAQSDFGCRETTTRRTEPGLRCRRNCALTSRSAEPRPPGAGTSACGPPAVQPRR